MPSETPSTRLHAVKKVSVVVPCEGLADFPLYYQADEAASLYTAWTLAWHPSLIAETGQLPGILSVYGLPTATSQEGHLALVPAPSQTVEVQEWLAELQSVGQYVSIGTDRQASLAELQQATAERAMPTADLAGEMYAFGYAYLQIEQLTGRLTDGSVVEASQLTSQVVAMAQAALDGDQKALERALRAGYDSLEQVRNHTYPTAVWMTEVVLTAKSTLGERLRSAVDETTLPVSLLLERPLLASLAENDPALLSDVKSAVEAGRVSTLITPAPQPELCWLSPSGLRRELTQTLQLHETLLGKRPKAFARLGSLLPPRLPQLLKKLGANGALLNGFDGAAPPMTDSVKVEWRGIDGTALPAVASIPLDLSRPESYLQLGQRIRETLDRDHTATLLLASWAGCRHPFYDDLRRVARRSRLLGEWITLEDYFAETTPPEHPYYTDGWWFGEEKPTRDAALAGTGKPPSQIAHESAAVDYDLLVAGLAQTVDLAFGTETLEKEQESPHRDQTIGGPMLNGWSFTRSYVEPASEDGEQRSWTVPGLGLARPHEPSPSRGPDRAAGRRLLNERMEVLLSETAGGISAAKLHGSNQNRFSQRLIGAIGGRGSSSSLEMKADELKVIKNTPSQGSLQATGQLATANGVPLVSFHQTVTLDALANHISVRGAVSLLGTEPQPSLWLASRIALPTGHWDCTRGIQWLSAPASGDQFLAGDYVQWQAQRQPAAMRLTFASSKLALIRRCIGRSQDQLQYDVMIPAPQKGEQEYEFHLAIDERYPLRLTLDASAADSATTSERSARGSLPAEAWLFHLDAANVQVAALQSTGDRSVLIELIETEGRAVNARLRACHPLKSAVLDDGNGNQYPLPIDEGAAVVETPAHAWMDVLLAW